jgi:hypothetical protein
MVVVVRERSIQVRERQMRMGLDDRALERSQERRMTKTAPGRGPGRLLRAVVELRPSQDGAHVGAEWR